MELKVYLKVFKKYWPAVIILTLFGAALGYFYTRHLPSGYRATQTFFIAPAPAGEFNIEANNAQEKARNFTDTATAIISSAPFQSQIIPSGQTLTVKKNAPQVLTISAHAPTREEAGAVVVKSKELFNSRFGSPGATLEEIGPAQTPQAILGTPIIYALAGAILGFGFAIFTISLKTYFNL